MNELIALYFDGASARPEQVRAMVLNEQLNLFKPEIEAPFHAVPLSSLTYNQVNGVTYIYLDQKGLQYLQAEADQSVTQLLKEISAIQTGWTQKLMKQKTPVLLITALALSVGLYLLLISLIPFIGSKMIGTNQEVIMGDKIKEVMMQEAALLGAEVDTAGTRQLQLFADQLHLSNQYPIRLTLLKSRIVNAYALPGGQIVVYSGILKKLDSPEALAALLAHESAHINERHSLKSLLRNAANSILISIVFGDVTGVTGALVGNANTINGLHYSRKLETEADEIGMELLLKNEIQLDGMLQLMQRLKEIGDIPDRLSFLSSHPLTSERINNVTIFINKHSQRATENKNIQLIFQKIKEQQADL